MQPGFFDLDNRLLKLDEKDPLRSLYNTIDWEAFRSTLERIRNKPRKSRAGRKPMDAIVMFKALIIQHLYALSDDELGFQIRDRYTFCRFLKLSPEGRVPDAKTIWLFREQLTKLKLTEILFTDFNAQLLHKGLQARKGQIVDASIIDAPKQRNNREENAQIKAGETPERFKENPNIGRQKDTDARWTKKNNITYYGYKNHICIDNKHKLIRNYDVTSASVHDSNVFHPLLTANTSKQVWADSAYRSEKSEIELDNNGYRSNVHKKGTKNKPLSDTQNALNKKKSSVRVRVEHIFGSIKNEQNGLFVRVIGLSRAATKIGLTNLVYNMRRMTTLSKTIVPAI